MQEGCIVVVCSEVMSHRQVTIIQLHVFLVFVWSPVNQDRLVIHTWASRSLFNSDIEEYNY